MVHKKGHPDEVESLLLKSAVSGRQLKTLVPGPTAVSSLPDQLMVSQGFSFLYIIFFFCIN